MISSTIRSKAEKKKNEKKRIHNKTSFLHDISEYTSCGSIFNTNVEAIASSAISSKTTKKRREKSSANNGKAAKKENGEERIYNKTSSTISSNSASVWTSHISDAIKNTEFFPTKEVTL